MSTPRSNKRQKIVRSSSEDRWNFLLMVQIEDLLGEYGAFGNINTYSGDADTKEQAQEKIGKEILRILNSEHYKNDKYLHIRNNEHCVKPEVGETAFQCIERLYDQDDEFAAHPASTMTFQENFKWKIAKGEVRT